ncbi:MAG: PspC domain-containing protein [Roseiflexaceae bacterium]|nr:PspC domain-containing protein [Roseiflexaceae bacterium]
MFNMETKHLYRSRDQRIIAGVAGGLANYFGVDPVIIRVALIVLTALNGFGLLIYLGLWLLVPNVDSVYVDSRSQVRENAEEMRGTAQSVVDRIRGTFSA